MADLSIEYFYQCVERGNVCRKFPKSKGEGNWVVEWTNYGYNGPHWHCSCPRFKYHKHCKHVKQVEAEYNCCWHQQFDGGEPVNGKCPQCGGEVKAVACGV
jgi:hypothetical protein